MLIDAHVHVASTRFVPLRFIEGIARNMASELEARGIQPSVSRIVDTLLAQHEDHLADHLVAEMDSAGVDRAVLLLPDFTHVLKSACSLADMASLHAQICERHPGRFHVFMGVDPRWGRDGLDLFERCVVRYGFQGMKLYPPCGYSPSDPMLDPFYELCQALRLPVLTHTGPTSPVLSFAEAHPMFVDRAAQRFPAVNFILAHAPVNDLVHTVQMCRFRSNVYCDISGFASLGQPRWERHLELVFDQQMNHKILFGSDWPVGKGSTGYAQAMKDLTGLHGPMMGLKQGERACILGRNLGRFLKGTKVQPKQQLTYA